MWERCLRRRRQRAGVRIEQTCKLEHHYVTRTARAFICRLISTIHETVLEAFHGVLDAFRQLDILLALQGERLAERDRHATGSGHVPVFVQHAIESLEMYGHNRHVQTRGHHADTRLKTPDLARLRPLAFGKDQNRDAVADEIADVAQRLTRAGFALRQRKRVEEERCQIVAETVRPDLPRTMTIRMEVRVE